jgi:hypothetical protein
MTDVESDSCNHERCEKTKFTGENLPSLPAAVCVAQEVGPRLGKCALLQRCLPQRQNPRQMMSTIWLIHLAVTWALVGLIWTIQLLNYPLFADIGEAHFAEYHQRHMERIAWLVGPLMLTEIATAGALLYLGERSFYFIFSLAALAVIWGSTALLQVPLHEKLVVNYEPRLIGCLVRTNWWRTLAWTLRGICLIAWLVSRL